MDIKGLEKTFGFKIPIYEHVDYYLETLKQSPQFSKMEKQVELYKDYEKSLKYISKTVKDDKMSTINRLVSHFHDIGFIEKLRNWDVDDKEINYQAKSFVPTENYLYVSIDINEANWTVSRHFLDVDLPCWKDFISGFGVHEALATSKPFRQYVLGNTIPKRFARMQKYLTGKHINMLPDNYRKEIAFVSEDEIIIKIDGIKDVTKIMDLDWTIPVKSKIFRTDFFTNYNEHVRVETIYDVVNNKFVEKYRELKKVPGDRYFIHFKTLILNGVLDERDILFKNNKHIAKWVI